MPSKAPPVIDNIKCSSTTWAHHIDTRFPGDKDAWSMYWKIIHHPAYRCISVTYIYSYKLQMYKVNTSKLFSEKERIRLVLRDILMFLNLIYID